MHRRDALKNLSWLAGAGLLSSTSISILSSCNTSSNKNKKTITESQQKLITEIADVIIPDTTCPGAKAAGVGPFITMMLQDCYPKDIQNDFFEGLNKFAKTTKSKFHNNFEALSKEDKIKAISNLREHTIKDKQNKALADKAKHFFPILRDLTIMGYFSSEIGAKQATVYLPVPGKYDGSMPLTPGQKAWADN